MNTRTKKDLIIAMLVIAMFGSGCASDNYQRNQDAYNMSIGGALIGGGLAAILAHNAQGLGDDAALLIPAGAGIGGGAGYYVGSKLDANRAFTNAAMAQANSTTVVIKVSNGATFPVTFVRGPGGGWIGPRGERYDNLPSEAQVGAIYGF